MACIVYREGTGTVEHDIECESATCDVNELHLLLADGWSQTPPGYVPPEPVPVEEQDLDSTITPPSSEESALQSEIGRLNGEVEALGEEIDRLHEQLELREGIEANLNATIEQLKEDLAKDRKPEGGEKEVDPVRAQGRDAGIDGWETMHLSSLKKALKELEA